jgi:uncharacterized membrane protein
MSHLAFHPFFSSLPLSALLVALLLEVGGKIYKKKFCHVVLWVQCFGTLMVTVAFVSGYFAAQHAHQSFVIPEDSIALHHRVGKTALVLLWLLPAANILRGVALHQKALFNLLYWAVFIFGIVSLAGAGYLGASLVFVHGAGVIAVKP